MSSDDSAGGELLLKGAILISDLERNGSVQLHELLASRLETLVQRAVWVNDLEATLASVVDRKRFQARHLREPLNGEIGTALAHRAAYETILEESPGWWVVFEDDAQILDATQLRNRIDEIIEAVPSRNPCIVNLNHRAARKPPLQRDYLMAGIWKPFVPTYTATAYLLNTSAARSLVSAQIPIQTQPDWPIDSRSVVFLQESVPYVEPNSLLPSVADPAGDRSLVPRAIQLRTWTWIWYLQHRSQFRGSGEYLHAVLLPRLARHLYRSK